MLNEQEFINYTLSKAPLLWRGVGVRLLFAIILILASCSRDAAVQGKGETYLQAEWKQDSIPMQKQLLSYSLYNFKFSCDSVFMQINSYSKVNSGADSCMNAGHWSEYIRGTYVQSHDTIRIRGNFCNADYTLKKQEGCFRSGPYEEFFKVTKKTDSLIQFSSTSNVIPVNLRLIKRISCDPKPL